MRAVRWLLGLTAATLFVIVLLGAALIGSLFLIQWLAQ